MLFHVVPLIIITALLSLTSKSQSISSNQPEQIIYVSNIASSLNPNGSECSPFTQLSDALNLVSTINSSLTSVTIMIAPTNQTYDLNNSLYIFNVMNFSALTFSTWQNPSPCDEQNNLQYNEKAFIQFSNSTIILENLNALSVNNIQIRGQDGSFSLYGTSLNIDNLTVIPTFGMETLLFNVDALFNCQDSLNITATNMDVTFGNDCNSLIKAYFDTTDIDPYIFISDLNLTFSNNTNLSEVLLTTSIIDIGARVEMTQGSTIIQNVQLNTENFNISSEYYLNPLLTNNGTQSVTVQNVSITDQSFYLANGNYLSWITVNNAGEVIIEDFTFTGNTINFDIQCSLITIQDCSNVSFSNITTSNNNFNTTILDTQYYFISLFDNNVYNFSNNSVQNNIINGDFSLYMIGTKQDSIPVKTSALFTQVAYLINNTNVDSVNHFSFVDLIGVSILNMIIDQVYYQNNQLSGRIFSFDTVASSMDLTLTISTLR